MPAGWRVGITRHDLLMSINIYAMRADHQEPWVGDDISTLELPPLEKTVRHVVTDVEIEPYHRLSSGRFSLGSLARYDLPRPLFTYHTRVDTRHRFFASAVRQHPEAANLVTERLEGRWVWGGEMMWHFGHFMSECSHRWYPLVQSRQEATANGIVFSARVPMPQWMKDVLSLHKLLDRVVLVRDRVVRVDELSIHPQGSILGGGIRREGYGELLDRDLREATREFSVDAPKKVFIGRLHLGTERAKVEDEEQIADYAESLGYTYMKPEALPLLQQLLMMGNVERLVAIGGSFVHLFDHLGRSKANILLINRGDPDAFYHTQSLKPKARSFREYRPLAHRGDTLYSGTNHDGGPQWWRVRYEMDSLKRSIREFDRK
jgi:hypothetical protein